MRAKRVEALNGRAGIPFLCLFCCCFSPRLHSLSLVATLHNIGRSQERPFQARVREWGTKGKQKEQEKKTFKDNLFLLHAGNKYILFRSFFFPSSAFFCELCVDLLLCTRVHACVCIHNGFWVFRFFPLCSASARDERQPASSTRKLSESLYIWQ